jgi:hypothetical protein
MPTKAKKKDKPEQCVLGTLIREFIAANKATEKLPKGPVKPGAQNTYTVASWNQYQKDLTDFNLKMEKHQEHKKAVINKVEELRKAIVAHIPRSLTWFVTEDKRYAIALQVSDWPGAAARVIYRENPIVDQLPTLRMQIIN